MLFSLEESLGFVEKTIPYCELGMEGTFGDSPVQPLCPSRVSYSRLLWSVSNGVLRPSNDGDSMHTLGNSLQCLTTLIWKKPPCIETAVPVFQLVQHWEEWLCLLYSPSSDIDTSWQNISSAFFCAVWQPQLYLPLPMCQILLPPNHLCSPSLDRLQYHQLFLVLGAQIWTQILDVSLQHRAEGNNPFSAWRPCSSSRSPGCCWPLLQRHRAKSWLACHPPTAPRPSVRPPSFG